MYVIAGLAGAFFLFSINFSYKNFTLRNIFIK